MLPVSTIIPTYNNRATLGAAIDSVLHQSAPPAQIIVVDDGSTDNTAEWVAERYGDKVELVVSRNGGPSRARNTGLERVREPYTAFLDADDCWHPDKLAYQMRCFNNDATLGTVATDWIREWAAWPDKLPPTPPITQVTYRDTLILNRFQTSTVVARTELLRRIGGFDPNVDGVEDWDCWVRLASLAGVATINLPLVQYRDSQSGYSKNLVRVYDTMPGMLAKHRAAASAHDFAVIEAWHQLRFAIAFYLNHDRTHAALALRRALTGRTAAVRASVQYLLPFLMKRMRRRLV